MYVSNMKQCEAVLLIFDSYLSCTTIREVFEIPSVAWQLAQTYYQSPKQLS